MITSNKRHWTLQTPDERARERARDDAFGRAVVGEFLQRKLVETTKDEKAFALLPAWARNSIALMIVRGLQ